MNERSKEDIIKCLIQIEDWNIININETKIIERKGNFILGNLTVTEYTTTALITKIVKADRS